MLQGSKAQLPSKLLFVPTWDLSTHPHLMLFPLLKLSSALQASLHQVPGPPDSTRDHNPGKAKSLLRSFLLAGLQVQDGESSRDAPGEQEDTKTYLVPAVGLASWTGKGLSLLSLPVI